MQHLTTLEIQNWTAICCGFAMALSVGTVAYEMAGERAWRSAVTLNGAILFVPRTWWRWQKRYFAAFPVTIAIVVAFGFSLQ